jgi:DNA/RNA endonuclease YhcR with UshA esterase domain
MNSRPFSLLMLVGVSLAVAPAVRAHHSQSEFDLRAKIEVEGTVTKLEWKSPHGRLYLDVKNAKGEIENWNFELPSPNTLMRRGWTRDTLKTGDHVTVGGAPARNFPTIAIATSIKDASGKPLFTGTTQIYEPESEPKASE